MKKIKIAAMLSVTLIGTMLSGCGNSNNTSGKVTLQILNYKREAVDILEELARDFEAQNTDIKIQLDSPSDALTILKTRLVKEDPPDIAIIGGDRSYADFVDADAIVDLTGYNGFNKVQDVYLEMAKQLELRPKEGIYSVPYAANAAGVLYNRDMFKENNWDIPQTWSEFMTLCDTIKASNKTPFYFMLKDSWTGITPWNAIAANLTTPDVYSQVCIGKTTFAEQYPSSLNKIAQLLKYSQEDPFAYNYNDGCTAFGNGESAMLLQGNWAIAQILGINPNMNIGSFTLPVSDKKDDTLLVSGVDILLSVMKDDYKDECLKFIDFMLEDSSIRKYIENQKAISCIKGDFPIPENLLEMASYWKEQKVIDFPDHHYPVELPAADMLQGYLMNGNKEDFLKRFDKEWTKTNRELIATLKAENKE